MAAGTDPPAQRPLHTVSGPARVHANSLLKVVANLPLKGIERSIKFSPGHFLPERFLVGLAPAQWSPALFAAIYADLHMPEAMQQQFAAAMARAHFLGLAFELGEQGCVYKAYLEYPVLVRHTDADVDIVPVLQYQGFKWDPEAAGKHAVTDYLWSPRLSREAIRVRFNRHLSALTLPAIPTLLHQVLDLAAARMDARELIFLEVGEAGSNRKSVDLNLYPAGIAVHQIAGQIADIGAQFGLDGKLLDARLTRDRDQILGHVSAGVDRNGKDFLTVYFDH